MNFDELKDAWAKEAVPPGKLSAELTARGRSAIDHIRRNMRMELLWTLISYVLLLLFLLFYSHTRWSLLLLCTASFLFMQTFYYFFRFFLFYRRTERYDWGLRKSLRQFVYEFELNMEIYKTYAFCVTPVAWLLWMAIMDSGGWMGFLQGFACGDVPFSVGKVTWIVVVLVLGQAFGVLGLKAHLRRKYGRYLIELKNVVEEMEEY